MIIWFKISKLILKYRLALLLTILLSTIFMAWHASKAEMYYEKSTLIPESDSDLVNLNEFHKTYGLDGNVLVIGAKTRDFMNIEFFNDWYNLVKNIKKDSAVTNVLSISNIVSFQKDTAQGKFIAVPIFKKLPQTQDELDALTEKVYEEKLFENLLFNQKSGVYLIAITINKEILNSKARLDAVANIIEKAELMSLNHEVTFHYSGLPYIRTIMATKVKHELFLFSGLALFITVFLVWLFFRSLSAALIPLLVVTIGAIFSVGTIHLFDFRISILSGLIPSLIVVIGVPNCVYLINKYHDEFRKHGNKVLSLTRMVQKIGVATLITNTTTAIGFGVFFIFGTSILKEFGLVVALNILLVFVISIILIPIIFSYLPAPEIKHVKHLENKTVSKMLSAFEGWILNRRKAVFAVVILISLISLYGASKINAISYIVDDIPKNDKVYTDLKFFEKHFGGLMPLEILVNTNKSSGAYNLREVQKAEEVQNILAEYKAFSKPISLVEIFKGANQAFYNNDPERYELFNNRERGFIMPYLVRSKTDEGVLNLKLTDSSQSVIRISLNMADIGTKATQDLMKEIKPRIDSIYEGSDAKITYTGSSLLFLKSNQYLIDSLVSSLLLAFILISLIMTILFKSWKVIIISILPNILPLLVTAGIMGYFGIALKPSTVLVFSVAFGIAVDDSIHFLTKYRQELLRHNWDIPKTVVTALRETGKSMLYTSIILFFGFVIFGASTFGGTVALGILTSITLIMAMLSNLIFLPTLIMSFDSRYKKRKKYKLLDPNKKQRAF